MEHTNDISNLEETFEEQQRKISALKELVRKSDTEHSNATLVAQQKVKNIAERLTYLKTKARSRHNLDAGTSEEHEASSRAPPLVHSLSMDQQSIAAEKSMSMDYSENVPLYQQQQEQPLQVQPLQPLQPQQPLSTAQKMALLRQQTQQNKERMAKHASSKQHLEQLVTQLKENFDTTQQSLQDSLDATKFGSSMLNLSTISNTSSKYDRHKSATDLSQPFNLDKERIKFLENRCRLLEKQLEKEKQPTKSNLAIPPIDNAAAERIKELEEKIQELEKQHHQNTSSDQDLERIKELEEKIQALEKQPICSDNASAEHINDLQEKVLELENALRTLEEEKNKLLAQHINDDYFELQNENARLSAELAEKIKRIADLEEVNDMLETTRCDLAARSNELEENLQRESEKLKETERKCTELQLSLDGYRNSQRREGMHENQDDTQQQVVEALAKQVSGLQHELVLLKEENTQLKNTIEQQNKIEVTDDTIAEKIASLEATINSQREDLRDRQEALRKQSEDLMEKTIELNVLNANFKVLEEKLEAAVKNKPLFALSSSTKDEENQELQTENQQLKQKLDELNKAMIKLKLKCKQTEKQMAKISKSSDLHAEIVKLQQSNEELQQRITELEDEKGQWQLTQVDNATENLTKDGQDKEKIQANTIRLLEEQKFEQLERLAILEQENEEIKAELTAQQSEESVRVKSEMSELHLEDQLEEQTQQIKQLEQNLSEKEAEVEQNKQQLAEMQSLKINAEKKLEHYINENIELLDKIEKLSKSSSSAESIEIVERLTQQERAELDEFNKQAGAPIVEHEATLVNELTQTEISPELNESLNKLREESSELTNKIELFTTERREVLEKMDLLTTENNELLQKLEELTEEKEQMETNALLAENEKTQLETKVQELTKEKDLLALQVAERTNLAQELTSMQKSSEVVAALDCTEGATLFDKCEKSLNKLSAELEAYRKANDKNSKITASKKLAKEAKNAYTQLSELLQKVKEASSAVETVTVVETVVAVTAPNGKALAEYEQLTAQNRQLKLTVDELRRELEEIQDTPALTQQKESTVLQVEDNKKLEEALEQRKELEARCLELQSTVEDLRRQLYEERTAGEERVTEITQLKTELDSMQKLSEEFDTLLNKKEMTHEKQIEQLTRLRKELEGKCETYQDELDILQTLVTEQKQQLIEAYKENEHELNLKLLDLKQRDEKIVELRTEIEEMKSTNLENSTELQQTLQQECAKLRESLKINKALVAEQIDDLANKQNTIDTLNQQIIELYRTMEENANKVIEKEDEIAYLQEMLDSKTQELERLHKDNNEQKSVVDKLLNELHSQQANAQQLPQLESELQRLEQLNKDLDRRNKEQLEKMKKYAANLKKRSTQCQELEGKLKDLEKGAVEALQSKELDEKIQHLEQRLKETEAQATEYREALQVKTLEQLEALERSDNLEAEMNQLRENLLQKTQETVQLQNALAASQEQISDWGAAAAKVAECDRLELEVVERRAAEVSLQNDLKHTLDNLEQSSQEIKRLQEEIQTQRQTVHDLQTQIQMQQQRKHELETQLQRHQANESNLKSELQQKHERIAELEKNIKELQQRDDESGKRYDSLNEEFKAKSIKFEKSKAVIKERNNQIHRLQAQLKDLQDQLSAQPEEIEVVAAPQVQAVLQATAPEENIAKKEYDALKKTYDELQEEFAQEKLSFQETVSRLETLHDGIQAKLQEDMAYIESLEQENNAMKEKICKLEECVAIFEERRASMERNANRVDEEMQSRVDEFEKTEDALINRLNALSEHDEVIAQRLQQSEEQKETLQERVERLKVELNEKSTQYAKLEKEYHTYQENIGNQLQAENNTLREQLATQEQEQKHQRQIFDAKLAAKTTEIDELECELSDQLDKITAEKRALTEDLERARDECTEFQDEIARLRETLLTQQQARVELERESNWLGNELQEMRMQSMQDKTENDNLRHQIETLAGNHEQELQGLRRQITALDSMRIEVRENQTDDEMILESEHKRLKDLLAEKEQIIRRLEERVETAEVSVGELDSAFVMPPPPLAEPTVDEVQRLQNELTVKDEELRRLQRENAAVGYEKESLVETNNELKRQLDTLRSSRPPVNQLQPPPASAPMLFFASEETTPSPFDEIIQSRFVDQNLQGAVQSHDNFSIDNQQPTIEDLQRNVCDLEKHAQELENKLLQSHGIANQLGERERQLLAAVERLEQQKVEDASTLEEFTHRLSEIEAQLRKRNAQLADYEKQCSEQVSVYATQQNQLKMLEENLKARELEVSKLREELTAGEQLAAQTHILEQQIITAPLIDAAVQPTLDLFFGNSSASAFENLVIPPVSEEPVVEDVIVPEKAYVCQPEDRTITALDLGDDWDDSWGANEAAAEAAHMNATTSVVQSLVPREQQLELQLQEQEERIQELQKALELHELQNKDLQLKSSKFLKKLKEYKVKIDELQAFKRSSSIETNDLDAAIQEELKSQLKAVEAKLEEQLKQQESYAAEKEKLLKRIDVLTAGNDRMAEMKDRQDMDVQMYQARIRELQEKLNRLEDWGNESPALGAKQHEEIQSQSAALESTDKVEPPHLQQKISELTAEIADINGDRQELQALLEDEKANTARAEEKVAFLERQTIALESEIAEYQVRLKELEEKLQTLVTENQQLKQDLLNANHQLTQVTQEMQELRESTNNNESNSYELQSELAHLREQNSELLQAKEELLALSNQDDAVQLKQQISELCNERANLLTLKEQHEMEISMLNTKIAQLENISSVQHNTDLGNADELAAKLQEKESEIMHLKQRIEDLMREDQTEKLVLEILTKNQELHLLKMQVKHLEEDKQELQSNLSLQITRDMQASKDGVQAECEALEARTKQMEQQIKDLQDEKQNMEEELKVLNNHVMNSLELEDKMKASVLELDTKNIEISELRKSLESVTAAKSNENVPDEAAGAAATVDYVALSAQWEAVVEQRCGDIARMWRDHLDAREQEFKAREANLQEEIATLRATTIPSPAQQGESTATSTPASESTSVSGSTSATPSKDGTPSRARLIMSENEENGAEAMLSKMQAALESQEMEIVTLKEQLAIRSAEYARLAAQYDPFKLQTTLSHSGMSTVSGPSSLPAATNRSNQGGDGSTVPKSELDLALYMLHQRDMRCEEMTLELVSLLEERDTLQLKLSNTLRQVEAIKIATNYVEGSSATSGEVSGANETDSPAKTVVAGPTLDDSSARELHQKLSQLHGVDHSKDKVIKEERDQRLRQMEKIQQDVAKMPNAALSELIGTDLSQTNQSPSSVLLNWLWGNKPNSGADMSSN